MPTRTYRCIAYDTETGEIKTTYTFNVTGAKNLPKFEPPPGVVDVSDDPDLFAAVSANPAAYRVEDGAIVPKEA